MNTYWRITKIALLGLILPAGVFALGYFGLGPNMSLLPRLDEKGWEVEVERLSALPTTIEPQPEEDTQAAPKPVISVAASKAERRRRQRPSFTVLIPGSLSAKPPEATAEVTPPETLTSN